MMKRLFLMTLDEVTDDSSQFMYLLRALQAKSQSRQIQEEKINERHRVIQTANFGKFLLLRL